MEDLDNYVKEKKTISLISANIFALILLIVVGLLYLIPYYLIWLRGMGLRELFVSFSENHSLTVTLLLFPIIILGIVFHELIHGVLWATYAKNGFRSIKFGIMWEMLTPYCHCKEPLTVRQYILGAIMPCIILGIIPAVISLFFGSFYLFLFGLFFTAAAAGDIMVIKMLSNEDKDSYVLDHPSEAGYYIFRRKIEV